MLGDDSRHGLEADECRSSSGARGNLYGFEQSGHLCLGPLALWLGFTVNERPDQIGPDRIKS